VEQKMKHHEKVSRQIYDGRVEKQRNEEDEESGAAKLFHRLHHDGCCGYLKVEIPEACLLEQGFGHSFQIQCLHDGFQRGGRKLA
jgi:hypothetical protein